MASNPKEKVKAFYTGIGSRETPEEVLNVMHAIAVSLWRSKWTLRSGGAAGADTAFERGAGPMSVIYLPWRGFNGRWGMVNTVDKPSLAAYKMASDIHPAWQSLGAGAKAMHARNCHQVLGWTLEEPSQFVVCWTPDGCEDESTRAKSTGGTATAIVLASRRGIPVFNLQKEDAKRRLNAYLEL